MPSIEYGTPEQENLVIADFRILEGETEEMFEIDGKINRLEHELRNLKS